MTWTTDPVIEYEVFLAACPYQHRISRISMYEGGVIIGSSVSTLAAFKLPNGCVGFQSHDPMEIRYFAQGIEEHFDVRILEY